MLIGNNNFRSNYSTPSKTANNLRFGHCDCDDYDAMIVLKKAKNYGGANYGEPMFDSVAEVKDYFRRNGKRDFRDILD